MNLPFTKLKAIKELNLPQIIQSCQIELKQNTYNNHYVGLCPFHDDKNPSFHVSFKNTKWIWHCFGCHASGGVIDFVIKKEGISFINAYRKLSRLIGKEIPKPLIPQNRVKHEEPPPLMNKVELLKRVVDYYHNTFKENPRGAEYLKKRGIMNPDIYRDYRIGFVDGSMKNTLNPEITQQLKQIGILNDKGNETFYNCVILPISDDDKNIVSLYGRNTERPSHLYLAGKHQGVFNGQTIRTNKTIILTESIIDCVSLIQLGVMNTVPLYGTNGLTPDHIQLFKKHLTKEIYLCLDSDESGQTASKRLSRELDVIGIATTNIKLPDVKDVNDYLLSGRNKKDFECLVSNTKIIEGLQKQEERSEIQKDKDGVDVALDGVAQKHVDTSLRQTKNSLSHSQKHVDTSLRQTKNSLSHSQKHVDTSCREEKPSRLVAQPQVIEENEQLHFNFQERQYRLRGFNVSRLDQLRVNIKIIGGDKHHLDTLDLYNARSRENFIAQSKKTLGLENGYIHRDLSFIVDHLESLQSNQLNKDSSPAEAEYEITDIDRAEALGFLKSNALFDQILKDFKSCGHVGEEKNLLLGYLASVSRKLSSPLAVLVISRSASGKTALQDAILSFTPPEDYEKYTRMTDQALFYKGEDSLKNKLLAIEEEKGANGCAYSLRNLQSSGGLSIATTTKDSITGKLKTDVYKVHGPTAIMITTTASEEADFETYNRFIILTVDESVEQTRKILEQQRLNESIEGIIAKRNRERIQIKHHNAQRLLKTLEVANPYSSQLTFIDTILRARREQPKYLSMIKVVALLRQYQKEIKVYDMDLGDVAQKHSNTFQRQDKKHLASLIEYISVDLKDIEIANTIANEILGRNLDELCPPARNLLIEIKRMIEAIAERDGIKSYDVQFNRRDIREYTKWNDYQIKTHLKQLEELEYIYAVHGHKGKRYSYQLLWDGQGVDGHKFMMGLIDVEKIKTKKL